MKFQHNLLLIFFILSVKSMAQGNTVYVVDISEETNKQGYTFSQLSIGLAFNANPDRGDSNTVTDNDSWLIPDGLSVHGGYGIHLKQWLGISANTGLDWRIKQKLVSAPVYGSIIVNPHFNKDTSVFMQAGLGHAFALGRGSLNGTYQKYRAGILFNDTLIYADASLFGYPLKGVGETGSFTIGISIIDF